MKGTAAQPLLCIAGAAGLPSARPQTQELLLERLPCPGVTSCTCAEGWL